jgi:integrase
MSTTTMVDRVEQYLAYRHALGYQLDKVGQLLRSFARFADSAGHGGPLTIDIALRWARLPVQAARMYQARRLEVVRSLARYWAAREPGTEVPPRGLLGPAHVRRPAFIYSEANIAALIQAADALGPADALRPHTYATLIGLLACTGLRIGEALRLRADDVDCSAGLLTVRQTKFHKSRHVPVHDSALEHLRNYTIARTRRHPLLANSTFFISDIGRPLRHSTVRETFHVLLQQAMPGVRPAGRPRPRLYDLRHTFACRRLLAWYRDGTDIHRAIDQLSVYLGHTKVSCTYWYLSAVPELLALAAERFERYASPFTGDIHDTDL